MSVEQGNATERFLTLTLDKERFALDIRRVLEILDMTDIARIPSMPDYMDGVVDVRGSATPVIDLRSKLGLPRGERTLNSRIVVMEIRHGDASLRLGAVTDSVSEVLELNTSAIGPPPRLGAGGGVLRGIAGDNGRFVLILDVDRIFSEEERRDIQQAPPPGRSGDAAGAAEA